MSKTIQEMHQKKQGKTCVYIHAIYIYMYRYTSNTKNTQANKRQTKTIHKNKTEKNRHTQKEDDFPFPVWWDMLVPWRVNKKCCLMAPVGHVADFRTKSLESSSKIRPPVLFGRVDQQSEMFVWLFCSNAWSKDWVNYVNYKFLVGSGGSKSSCFL